MPMTPADLEAYRRRFEAARSFEDDEQWFKEPIYTTTTNNSTPIVTANKPALKATAPKWSFQGIQPPTGPKMKKAAMESGAMSMRPGGAVQHPAQYPRSGLGSIVGGSLDYQKSSAEGSDHDRVDSRASNEMDEQSLGGSGDLMRR